MKIKDLQTKFRKMEDEGRVDTSVVGEIEELEEDIKESAKKMDSDSDRLYSYKTYFAFRTQIDILENMKDRIEKSKEKNDNPQVAKDSLAILDYMADFDIFTREKIKESTFSDFLKLQQRAKDLDLFPDIEEFKERINLSDTESANRLFDNIRNGFKD